VAGFDRGAGSVSSPTYASLLRGGQASNSGPLTFRTDVATPNAWYLISVVIGDATVAHDQMRITNADTGQILLDGVNTVAGQFVERNFVVKATGNGIRLTFSDLEGIRTGW